MTRVQSARAATDFGLPTLRGIEHLNVTVADLDEVTEFFVSVFGCRTLYTMGPFENSKEPFMRIYANADVRSVVHQVRVLRSPFLNIELFQVSMPRQRQVWPDLLDIGGWGLTAYVDDIDAAISFLYDKDVYMLDPGKTPITWPEAGDGALACRFMTRFGLHFELVSFPTRKANNAEAVSGLWNPAASDGDAAAAVPSPAGAFPGFRGPYERRRDRGAPDTVPAVHTLKGRVAVVTGAASGIGLAVSEALVAEGMSVVMADVNDESVRLQASRLLDQGAAVVPMAVDVSDPAALDSVGRAVVAEFGALHVTVNNAGIVNGGHSWELSLEEWHRVLDTNLWGVIHGVRTFVPLILASGEEGHVVNVASLAAVIALGQLGPYTVAKHGVLGLSDVLRAELRSIDAPVGVSVVMPGMIRTGMNPMGTVEPSTVAANIVDAIRRNRDYVFTDDHHVSEVDARLRAILASRADVQT